MSERPTTPQQDTEDLKHPQNEVQRPEDGPNLTPLAANEQQNSLQEFLHDPNPDVRISMIEMFGEDSSKHEVELKALALDSDPLVRRAVVYEMGSNIELFADQLKAALEDEDGDVRSAVVREIAKHPLRFEEDLKKWLRTPIPQYGDSSHRHLLSIQMCL